jgi:hypothetical protein
VVTDLAQIVTIKTRGTVGEYVSRQIGAPQVAWKTFVDGVFQSVFHNIGRRRSSGADVIHSPHDLPVGMTVEEFDTFAADSKKVKTAIAEACLMPGIFKEYIDPSIHQWEYDNGKH